MSRIVMTFEAYQTYNDYLKDAERFRQTPESLEYNVKLILKRLMPTLDDKWISSVEDVSDEKKGIKFEIRMSTGDVIHAFKVGSELGKWEFYLNKKKTDESSLKKYFLENAISPLERWELKFKNFDHNWAFADDMRAYRAGQNSEKEIMAIYDTLSTSDKRKAYKIYSEKGFKDTKPFAEFKGV